MKLHFIFLFTFIAFYEVQKIQSTVLEINWTKYSNSASKGGIRFDAKSLFECKKFCEDNHSCVAIDFNCEGGCYYFLDNLPERETQGCCDQHIIDRIEDMVHPEVVYPVGNGPEDTEHAENSISDALKEDHTYNEAHDVIFNPVGTDILTQEDTNSSHEIDALENDETNNETRDAILDLAKMQSDIRSNNLEEDKKEVEAHDLIDVVHQNAMIYDSIADPAINTQIDEAYLVADPTTNTKEDEVHDDLAAYPALNTMEDVAHDELIADPAINTKIDEAHNNLVADPSTNTMEDEVNDGLAAYPAVNTMEDEAHDELIADPAINTKKDKPHEDLAADPTTNTKEDEVHDDLPAEPAINTMKSETHDDLFADPAINTRKDKAYEDLAADPTTNTKEDDDLPAETALNTKESEAHDDLVADPYELKHNEEMINPIGRSDVLEKDQIKNESIVDAAVNDIGFSEQDQNIKQDQVENIPNEIIENHSNVIQDGIWITHESESAVNGIPTEITSLEECKSFCGNRSDCSAINFNCLSKCEYFLGSFPYVEISGCGSHYIKTTFIPVEKKPEHCPIFHHYENSHSGNGVLSPPTNLDECQALCASSKCVGFDFDFTNQACKTHSTFEIISDARNVRHYKLLKKCVLKNLKDERSKKSKDNESKDIKK